MPEKLKPCPFCGGQAIRVSHPGRNWNGEESEHVNIGAQHNTWYVGCPSGFFEESAKPCEVCPSASWYAHLEDAEKAWNDRN